MKRYSFLLLIFCIVIFSQPSFCESKEVVLVPEYKITTSNANLSEGDYVDFYVRDDVYLNGKVYIKRATKAEGLVTYLRPNDWKSEPAQISITQFQTTNCDNKKIKLDGGIYKNGNSHPIFMEFCSSFVNIRGGEVQIKPETYSITVFLKDNL